MLNILIALLFMKWSSALYIIEIKTNPKKM